MSSSNDFEWTAEAIADFWDEVTNEPRVQHLYFTDIFADRIVEFAKLAGLSGGKLLDYGSGMGFLTHELVKQGYDVSALEFSKKSADHLNQSLPESANWHGCTYTTDMPTPLPENEFDFIFSIETYEHLLEEWIDPYLQELYRLVKPGGKVFISVPCKENLHDSLMICPGCSKRFHRWGHLRTISPADIFERAKKNGFLVELSRGINFRDVGASPWPDSLMDLSLRGLIKGIQHGMWKRDKREVHKPVRKKRVVQALEEGPHLVMVARKPEEASGGIESL